MIDPFITIIRAMEKEDHKLINEERQKAAKANKATTKQGPRQRRPR